MTATADTKSAPHFRLALLDVIRGVAILAMVVYHLGWDLSAYRLIAVDVTTSTAWIVFARSIAGTFLALVGINLVLATRRGFRLAPYLRRLAVIVAAAAIVSLGTYWFMPGSFVFFGILHCIALGSVLALPFLRAPLWLIALAAVLFLAGPQVLTSPSFDSMSWYWLGLSTDPPTSVDYVPIFPWFGVVLLGVIGGRLILDHAAAPLWQWNADGRGSRFLIVAGRWSLPIYLVHQPILIGIIMLVAPLLGPSEATLARQLTSEYDATCTVSGHAPEDCAAYTRCILSELSKHEGILIAAFRHQLSEPQRVYWETALLECQAKTLPPPAVSGGV